jgi:enterochelin esterase-like enzyme
MFRSAPGRPAVLVVRLFALLSPLGATALFAHPPAVSWVNPQLPPGSGLTHHAFASAALGHEVGCVVGTPPGYRPDGTTRYATVYFLHGMGGNESADSAGFSGPLARGLREGRLPPVIAVFPNGGGSGYRGTVETMILEELVPWVDRIHPTQPDPGHRVVVGYSMGGSGAVRLALRHPHPFGVAVSWGGGLGRESREIVDLIDPADTEVWRARGLRLRLVNGDSDRLAAFLPLVERLGTMGLAHEFAVLPQTPHNLGRYYALDGDALLRFLAAALSP